MLSAGHTWSLTAIAIAFGMAMLWSFRRFTNQAQVALAKRKIRAHLYAFRLFSDEPALILRAQKQLLIWNARYLALMLRPTAVVLLPTALLLFGLEALYGHRALLPGESAIVTAQFRDGADVLSLAPTLEGAEISVETPSVRIPDLRQISWRVRALSATSGSVILRNAGAERRVGISVAYPTARIDIFGFGVPWLLWFLAVSLLTMLLAKKRFGVIF